MKMFTIVCRERLKDEVLVFFKDQGIPGYTMINEAGGSGRMGEVSGTHGWRDRNTMFMIALEDGQIPSLVGAVTALHARLVQENSHIQVPFRAFLQPCEVIV